MVTSQPDAQPASPPADTSDSSVVPHSVERPSDEVIVEVHRVAYRVARGRGAFEEDAADIAQIVAEKFIQQSPPPDNPAAWAKVVAGRKVIDLDRRRKVAGDPDQTRRSREVELPADGLPGLDGVMAFVMAQRSVSAAGIRRQALAELEELLAEHISAKERQIVAMIAQGASYQQIAEELGYKNADSVKTTVNKMRRKLVGVADQFEQFRQHPRVY